MNGREGHEFAEGADLEQSQEHLKDARGGSATEREVVARLELLPLKFHGERGFRLLRRRALRFDRRARLRRKFRHRFLPQCDHGTGHHDDQPRGRTLDRELGTAQERRENSTDHRRPDARDRRILARLRNAQAERHRDQKDQEPGEQIEADVRQEPRCQLGRRGFFDGIGHGNVLVRRVGVFTSHRKGRAA